MSNQSADPVTSEATVLPATPQGELFGHPRGLFVLFSTELWERFSFYAMRGVLSLYMVAIVLAHLGPQAEGRAIQIYGAYLGFVYSATFIGGMLADRLLGQRRAIYIGGFLMSLAQFTLMTHALLTRGGSTAAFLQPMFFLGLRCSPAVMAFSSPTSPRSWARFTALATSAATATFTIFYVGINIGAALSSLASMAGEKWGWYLGYMLAGSGMIASLIIFTFGKRAIGSRGLPPAGAAPAGPRTLRRAQHRAADRRRADLSPGGRFFDVETGVGAEPGLVGRHGCSLLPGLGGGSSGDGAWPW